ncbi:MAG: RNA methyltransferase [candidate division KSB1 bacterium]|nr:RNA methyltransferase [candidate division KSB1 bacterium]MDZ7319147.1 RNA methyltransferase [candidate division KSB1 bacterium]
MFTHCSFDMISKTRFKKIQALKHKRGRIEQGLFLIEGLRLCEEALLSDHKLKMLLVCHQNLDHQAARKVMELAQQRQVEIVAIDGVAAKQLAETVHSQGIFGIVQQQQSPLERLFDEAWRFLVIVDTGQDPGNVGTIIRACDWFGVDAVVFSKGSVELYNPKVVRSTMGSIFHVPVFENTKLELLLPALKQRGFQIFAADVQGEQWYHRVQYRLPLALIMGNENRGVDRELESQVDCTIAIPRHGQAESLNMAVAAGIILSKIAETINQ